MITPPWHLILSLIFLEVRVRSAHVFLFPLDLWFWTLFVITTCHTRTSFHVITKRDTYKWIQKNSHTRVVLELRRKWRYSIKLNICQYYFNMFENKLVKHIIYYIIYLTCGALTITKCLKLASRKVYREEKYSSKKK